MSKTSARLPRVLGLFDVAVLSSGSMGPAYSLASTLGLMVAVAGAWTPVALLALTLVMLCVAASFMQLSRVLPHAGSSYAWIGAAFGRKVGAYAAWILLISNFFATMATAVPAGVYTLDLLAPGLADSPVWEAVVGVIWILVGAVLLHAGLRATALVTAFLVFAECIVLVCSAGVSFFVHTAYRQPVGDAHAVVGVGMGGVVSAMLLAIWMVDGWELSASTSEETHELGTTAGRGGFIALLLTSGVLLLAVCAYMRVGTIAGFTQHQADAMTYVAERLGGGAWRYVIVTTVLISTSTALWTTLLYLTRSVYAMGREGILPSPLGALDAQGRTACSLVMVTIFVCAATLLNGFWPTVALALQFVVSGSSLFLGLLFFGSCAAALRLAPLLRSGFIGSALSFMGAAALLAIIIAALLRAEMTVRLVDLGLLLAGLVFVAGSGGSCGGLLKAWGTPSSPKEGASFVRTD